MGKLRGFFFGKTTGDRRIARALLVSGVLSALLALAVVHAAVTEALAPGVLLATLALGVACGVKAWAELAAGLRLRRTPDVPLPPAFLGTARVSLFAWSVALPLAVLNLVWFSVWLIVLMGGLVYGLLIAIATLGFAAGRVYDQVTDLLATVGYPFTLERGLVDAILAFPAGHVLLGLLAAWVLLGPTICAVYLLARGPAAPTAPSASR